MSYTGLVERGRKVAEASRRENGSTIPLGELLTDLCDAIEALTRPVDVEAVARAIERSLAFDVDGDARAGELTIEERRKVAQAALAAMEATHADG